MPMPMTVNDPVVRAEITDAFWRYTNAIAANDIDTVIAMFWDSTLTLRYGANENLYGMAAIRAFRNGQRGARLDLEVTKLVVTAFGRDFGTANCELERSDTRHPGRMSHTWVRLAAGWRIVAAHVSNLPAA